MTWSKFNPSTDRPDGMRVVCRTVSKGAPLPGTKNLSGSGVMNRSVDDTITASVGNGRSDSRVCVSNGIGELLSSIWVSSANDLTTKVKEGLSHSPHDLDQTGSQVES
jgi:hypothetical protein